jgi:hypothetical protein
MILVFQIRYDPRLPSPIHLVKILMGKAISLDVESSDMVAHKEHLSRLTHFRWQVNRGRSRSQIITSGMSLHDAIGNFWLINIYWFVESALHSCTHTYTSSPTSPNPIFSSNCELRQRTFIASLTSSISSRGNLPSSGPPSARLNTNASAFVPGRPSKIVIKSGWDWARPE